MAEYTIGIDLGDRNSRLCVLDSRGDVIETSQVRTTKLGLEQRFASGPKARIALEAGTHSGWVSRLLSRLGHEVIVANPRDVEYVSRAIDKTDQGDAEKLARLARADVRLLAPIRHRSETAQVDLTLIRSRDELVSGRTALVNHVRSVTKSMGDRLPSCSTPAFADKAGAALPEVLRLALQPVIEMIRRFSESIRSYDRHIRKLGERYPAMMALQEVSGVGPVTAATYVLTLEDPTRFRQSRDVGPYLGLVPRKRQSGDSDPQLRITKAGDSYLRRLLVQCAQYLLGPFGEDSDLRRWGMRLAQRAGKRSKKRAVVAVARKLAVLLHALWTKKTPYRRLREPSVPAVGEPVGV